MSTDQDEQLLSYENQGQVNQKYIEGNHEAIINKEKCELVQLEVELRNQYRQDNHINFYIIQCEQNPLT